MELDEKLVSRERLRKWLKIFAVFLVLMWICTIISKSIYVARLPRVQVQTLQKKYVEHIVETDGIVTSGGELAVNVLSGLRVSSIKVQEGDYVEQGVLLFDIDLDDLSEAISNKEAELKKLKYHLSDTQFNQILESQKKEISILWAQEDYESADKETATTIERAQKALSEAETELNKHLGTIAPFTSDSARQEAWDDYNDWKRQNYEIIDKITAKEREIARLQEQLESLMQETSSQNSPQIENSETTIVDNLNAENVLSGNVGETNISENEEAYQPEGTGEESVESEETSEENTEPQTDNSSEEGTESESQVPESSEEGTQNEEESESSSETNTETAQETEESKEQNEQQKTDSMQTIGEANSDNKDAQNTKKEKLEKAIKNANQELIVLKDLLTEHERDMVSQPDYSAEEMEYDSWQQKKSSLEDAVWAAKCSLEDARFARENTLRQKMRAIASAEVLSPADSTASIYALEIGQLQSQIDDLKSLKKKNGEILAQKNGFVSKIQIQVGGRTTDTAALLLTDADAPCQFKFSITNEQGKYLKLGDSVELKIDGTSMTGSAELEATVDYLTEGAAGGYDIICRLPEKTGQPGAGGSVYKAIQGELHNSIIPIEALYDEKGVYYIYTLNEKTGILGKEFYVEKIKVRVADQNDMFAALQPGTVGSDTQIVTFCSEQLKQGASVRLVE